MVASRLIPRMALIIVLIIASCAVILVPILTIFTILTPVGTIIMIIILSGIRSSRVLPAVGAVILVVSVIALRCLVRHTNVSGKVRLRLVSIIPRMGSGSLGSPIALIEVTVVLVLVF